MPLSPLPARDFGPAAARHLLLRAGYGGTPAQVRELHARGLHAAVDFLLDFPAQPDGPEPDLDPDVIRARTKAERELQKRARDENNHEVLDRLRTERQEAQKADRKQFAELQRWWLGRMAGTPAPLRERLTFFWHGHFATSQRSVRDSYLMYAQNATLRAHAAGPFADLLAAVVHDPAMLKYLNNDRNVKGRPNENLARELLELFTLGEGHYTEADIKETARALTGLGVHDNDAHWRKGRHDPGDKSILGQTGPFDGPAVAELLATQPACADFIALKLYDHFVADVGDVGDVASAVPDAHRGPVADLAATLRAYDMHVGDTLRELFRSRRFYAPAVVGRKIKSPIQLVVGTHRGLTTPVRQKQHLLPALKQMGQVPFEPPTVDGWDGGRAWINTSTLFVRQNYTTYLATGVGVNEKMKPGREPYRPTRLLTEAQRTTPRAAADALIDHTLGDQVPAARREPLHALADDLLAGGVTDEPLSRFVAAVCATPEYQLC